MIEVLYLMWGPRLGDEWICINATGCKIPKMSGDYAFGLSFVPSIFAKHIDEVGHLTQPWGFRALVMLMIST